MRIVTIKNPLETFDGSNPDNLAVGKVFDVSPQVAIPMMAAGWVRSETRSRIRRQDEMVRGSNRREVVDRRSAQ